MGVGVGDTLSNVQLKVVTSDGPEELQSGELFAGKKVVVFGVVGAFTPTCTLDHLPGYVENAAEIRAKGVDDIIVVTVNDPFVVDAWARQSGGFGKIKFVADWDGAFVKANGLDIQIDAPGLGLRSKRFSLIAEDGVVKSLNVEENPGEADVSNAANMLMQLDAS